MQILIGLIIIAGVIYLFTKRTQKDISTASDKTLSKKEDLFTVTHKSSDNNTTEISIDLNEKVFIQRVNEGAFEPERKSNENSIEDITGFYGSEEYSLNKEYCVSYSDGHYDNDKWKNGDLALIKGGTLLFKKKIQRPNDCHVSNDGIAICCDWLNSDDLTGRFIVFDINGEQIFSKKTAANLGVCAISDDSKIALFETHYSETGDGDKIYIVDIEEKKVIHKFQRLNSFNSAYIDTENRIIKLKDHRGFITEIDFKGNQTNKANYENQVLVNGSVYDRLIVFETKSDEEKKDEKYLKLLMKGLTDKDVSYSFGKDKIYRKIGEYYDAMGDIEKTIENWEKAMQINPKIGVKRKLDILKKRV